MVNYQHRIDLVSDYLVKSGLSGEVGSWFDGKNILVTGGAGAIGSNLVIALSVLVGDRGKVVVLDNLSSIKEKNPWNIAPLGNIMFVEGDIRSDIDLKRVFKEDISIVYHLAAFFANQNSVDWPEKSADVDILGIIRILEYARLAKVDRFVYASSGCAIYGSYGQMPLREDFISMHLTTPYQVNKMAGEMYCNFYYHHYELPIVNCRFFNSYGPGEVPGQYRNVVPNFIQKALIGENIIITGTGDETRDFTYISDNIDLLLLLAYSSYSKAEVFNGGTGKKISIRVLAEMIIKYTNSKSTIIYAKPRNWDHVKDRCADNKKSKALLGYDPKVDFEEGLMKTIEWIKSKQP